MISTRFGVTVVSGEVSSPHGGFAGVCVQLSHTPCQSETSTFSSFISDNFWSSLSYCVIDRGSEEAFVIIYNKYSTVFHHNKVQSCVSDNLDSLQQ